MSVSSAARACLLVLAAAASLVMARDPDADRSQTGPGHFDIRVHAPARAAALAGRQGGGGAAAGSMAARLASRRATLALEAGRLRRSAPDALVEAGGLLGAVERLSAVRGGLSAASPGATPQAVVRSFFSRYAALYGLSARQAAELEVTGVSGGRDRALTVVHLRQSSGGLPVWQGEARAVFDQAGRLVATVGRLAPDLPDVPRSGAGSLSPAAALQAALSAVGAAADAGRAGGLQTRPGPGGWRILASPEPARRGEAYARDVIFPLAPGVSARAVAHVLLTRDLGDWYVVVDAISGELLFRKSLRLDASTQEARFSVYMQPDGMPADSPAPASPNTAAPGLGTQYPAISRSVVAMSALMDATASPDGWIRDGDSSTLGPNIDAFLDQDGDDLPDPFTMDDLAGRPVGNPDAFGRDRDFLGDAPRNFVSTPPPVGSDPEAGDQPYLAAPARGAVTQLFVAGNIFHDVLHGLGFDEAAGNFQDDNFGRGGLGGDALRAAAQWGAIYNATSNANITPTPDGIPPVLRMFLFTNAYPIRDSALDSEIVIHELAHGLTNRLVGDAAGLNWGPGLAMGEGWSDFYAMALLNGMAADDPEGRYTIGSWASYLFFGIFTDNYVYGVRRFPYSTDNGVNPLTWADVDETSDDMGGGMAPSPLGLQYGGAWEVHNAGEVWALSLWEMRRRIIAAHGDDVAAGNGIALQIVTDALKLTPLDPGFTQARDALLLADCAASGCAHEEAIWGGFADRGLGYGAEASLGIAVHVGVGESFDLPHLAPGQVLVDDGAGGNGNGRLEPGETADITVELINPWRSPAKDLATATATLAAVSPFVSILDDTALYGALPAQGSATGDAFTVQVDAGVPCGATVDLMLTTDSGLGVTAAPLKLRLGVPIGPGSPVELSRVTPGGLPIPEGDPQGVVDSLMVADDLEIVDLDLRLDEIRHTAIGDLIVMLRAPWGHGADLIFRPLDCDPDLGCQLGLNSGDDFLGTVIDDDALRDMTLVGASAAPFTGPWMPAFNSPEWTFPDPVGQMSRFAGQSTAGEWRLMVSDNEAFDSGEIKAWSLVVTPMAYACDCNPADAAFTAPPAEITGVAAAADAGLTLTWDAAQAFAGPSTLHDVVRGRLGQWPVGAGPDESCLVSGAAAAEAVDGGMPPVGSGYWYLVRGRNACSAGGWGQASDSSLRSAGSCPE